MTLNPLLPSDAVGNREQCLKSFLVSLLLFLSWPEISPINQFSRMYFVLRGITFLFLVGWENPARGRVVVDALVIPGLYSSIKRVD